MNGVQITSAAIQELIMTIVDTGTNLFTLYTLPNRQHTVNLSVLYEYFKLNF